MKTKKNLSTLKKNLKKKHSHGRVRRRCWIRFHFALRRRCCWSGSLRRWRRHCWPLGKRQGRADSSGWDCRWPVPEPMSASMWSWTWPGCLLPAPCRDRPRSFRAAVGSSAAAICPETIIKEALVNKLALVRLQ